MQKPGRPAVFRRPGFRARRTRAQASVSVPGLAADSVPEPALLSVVVSSVVVVVVSSSSSVVVVVVSSSSVVVVVVGSSVVVVVVGSSVVVVTGGVVTGCSGYSESSSGTVSSTVVGTGGCGAWEVPSLPVGRGSFCGLSSAAVTSTAIAATATRARPDTSTGRLLLRGWR